MKNKTLTLHFYADTQHGWLKVNLTQLYYSGVKNEISDCSYMRTAKNGNMFFYLEEDCDAGIFLDAMKKRGINVKLVGHHSDNSSRIRNYNRYSVNAIK